MTDLGFDRPLYILPFDHRGSFQSGLFGWKGTLPKVDGGVGPENIRALADAGMTIAVAGTSVFDPRASVAANVRVLRAACGLRESA